MEAAAWLGCGVLAGIAGLLLADLVALDATTLTFLVISSLAAALIARLRSITVTFVAAIVIGVVHDLLTPITSLTNYRDMTPFVLAAIALLVLSRHRRSCRAPAREASGWQSTTAGAARRQPNAQAPQRADRRS